MSNIKGRPGKKITKSGADQKVWLEVTTLNIMPGEVVTIDLAIDDENQSSEEQTVEQFTAVVNRQGKALVLIESINEGEKVGIGAWIKDKTGEYFWDKNIDTQESFDKSKYNKNDYSYAGKEFQIAYSEGSTGGLYVQYYGPDGNTSIHDYPSWVTIGKSHIGLTEGGNPIIQAMIDKMNNAFPRSDGKKPIYNDSEPWCGVFVYSCLTDVGIPITSNSWQTPALNTFYSNNWNEAKIINDPKIGAIAVMSYAHVAMVVEFDNKYVWILGGNQPVNGAVVRDGEEVNISKYNRNLVSKYVIPVSYNNPPPLGTFKE